MWKPWNVALGALRLDVIHIADLDLRDFVRFLDLERALPAPGRLFNQVGCGDGRKDIEVARLPQISKRNDKMAQSPVIHRPENRDRRRGAGAL
jgi:hypothetical protein